jgi:hypothetical protein
MKTNIGGSILPSSSPHILTPIPFKGGELQVCANVERDTHELIFSNGMERTVLAEHPNGYSCHALAKRMVNETLERAMDQAEYIVQCGGKSELALIVKAMGKVLPA